MVDGSSSSVAVCMSCGTMTFARRWVRLVNCGSEEAPVWEVNQAARPPDAVRCPKCDALCLPDQDPPQVLVGEASRLQAALGVPVTT